MKKLQIEKYYIEDIVKKKGIEKEQLYDIEYIKKLKKEDFLTDKIYILRKVERI